jgi:hypothetical protein
MYWSLMKEAVMRDPLPRIFELKDLQADSLHPDAFFRDFEQSLRDEQNKYAAFVKLERQLAVLDPDAWEDLKHRAAGFLQTRIDGRGWQALFDVFSEALGYVYLRSIGTTNIRFIPRAQTPNIRTPDLEGRLNGDAVLCEVKTINISAMEAKRRSPIHHSVGAIVNISIKVDDGLMRKLMCDLADAVMQLDAKDPMRKDRRFIFIVIHYDDWVGDFYPDYFRQIDEHILANPLPGAEVVFYPASNLYGRTFTMRSAQVFDTESSILQDE